MGELEQAIASPWTRRRRFALRTMVVLTGAGFAGLTGAMMAPRGDTTVVNPVRQETHIVQLATPVAPAISTPIVPVTQAADDPCPAVPDFMEQRRGLQPDRDIDIYDYRLGDVGLIGVAGSATRPESIAAWNKASIYLSTDDGRTFRRVLDGPGEVAAVAFDCRDRIYAWRTGLGLGMRDAESESWRPLDAFDVKALVEADPSWGKRMHLAVNGNTVAVAGPARLRDDHGLVAVTHDAGASWRFADLDYYDRIAGLDVADDGSVFVAADWSDCMIEGTNAFTIPRGSGELQTVQLGDWGLSAVGADRTVYSVGADCDGPLCARGADDTSWRRVRGLPKSINGLDFVPSTRGMLVRTNGRVYALEGRRATRVTSAEGNVDLVDAAHRILWIDAGVLHRRSKRFGERLLLGQRTIE